MIDTGLYILFVSDSESGQAALVMMQGRVADDDAGPGCCPPSGAFEMMQGRVAVRPQVPSSLSRTLGLVLSHSFLTTQHRD